MSSNASKRRKVTVDIKQTRLERGSVFARLGNKDKLKKKVKAEPESSSKTKKEVLKSETDAAYERKKAKHSSKPEAVASVKKDHLNSGKSKDYDSNSKEYKKSHRYSEEKERTGNPETGRSHSKHKFDRTEEKLNKMENLIIEKRVSPSPSPQYRLRSASPSSLSPKKKSKKHSAKRSSREKSQDHLRHHQSLSPERPAESHKHKERGRSREKKKASKDLSKKNKEVLDEEQDFASKVESSKHFSAKAKKSSKHGKHEKEYFDEVEPEKKRSKSKHVKEVSVEREKNRHKISPVIFDQSSDDHAGRKREKLKDRVKAKRKKYESASPPSSSPVRRKKAKREHSAEDSGSKVSSPVKAHVSKKRSYKDTETMSKKKAQKEDSLQGTYSDYSSASKHSQPEYSEISLESGSNDKHYSSDSFSEKETKKKSKIKKKSKKDTESFSSKAHYEVIDDDFSDDAKKVKKKKRKREETGSPYLKSPVKQDEKRLKKERARVEPSKKKEEPYPSSPPREKARHSDKYTHDRHDSYERRSSPSHDRFESSRRQKFSAEIRSDLRNPEDKYYDSRKERDRDSYGRGKDVYPEPKHSREERFLPDRRDSGYTKSKLAPRHLASERSTDSKVVDWQRKTSKHVVSERKESLPRLMSTPYMPDRRSEVSRQPASKYTTQRKLLEPEYLYPHEPLMGDTDRAIHGSLDRGKRNVERRPPPLLPPNFTRTHTPPRTRVRDIRSYVEQDRFVENPRKPRYRDSLPRNDNRDPKYSITHDDGGSERLVRSSSHDSRSSLRHSSLDRKGRHQLDMVGSRSLQSPHSDRNSSLERKDYKKPVVERPKYKNDQAYDRRAHHSLERVKKKTGDERLERGRPGERSRPLKRHTTESDDPRRPSSLHTRVKEKKQSPRNVLPSKRRTKETSRSSSKRGSEGDSSRTHSSKKNDAKKQSEDLSDADIDELIKEDVEEPPREAEVDWNELPTAAIKGSKATKEKSSVLTKFSPGNILRQTGIIMAMLPPHLIDKIKELEEESAEKEATETPKSFVAGMLRNGLNAFSDEKLRMRMLGYNISSRRPFCPPLVINAKTYSASMKEYMRKMRMVETV